MAYGFVHYTCCLIVLTTFVDRGDGRWKKKDRENLQYDIELFRKMADKIGHEIEDFYDEYSSQRLKEQIFDSLLQKYKSKIVSNDSQNMTWRNGIKSHDFLPIEVNRFAHKIPFEESKENLQRNVLPDVKDHQDLKKEKDKGPKWPKFDDILLEMGKRYDWKNDRWLKVKVKLKEIAMDKLSDNNVDIHEKHKFHYKIVKLNRSKNRRNVVVAVSAVR